MSDSDSLRWYPVSRELWYLQIDSGHPVEAMAYRLAAPVPGRPWCAWVPGTRATAHSTIEAAKLAAESTIRISKEKT